MLVFFSLNKRKNTFFQETNFHNPNFRQVYCVHVYSLDTRLKNTQKVDFLLRNIISENCLKILKTIQSVNLRPKHAYFWSLTIRHTLQNKFNPFCNRKFPHISHTSSFSAKSWNFGNTVFVRKNNIPGNVSELTTLWFKSARNVLAIRPVYREQTLVP